VSPAGAPSTGSPKTATKRPASVVAPFTLTCWPITARIASSKPSKAPGTRSPGCRATTGAIAGSVEEPRGDELGPRAQVEDGAQSIEQRGQGRGERGVRSTRSARSSGRGARAASRRDRPRGGAEVRVVGDGLGALHRVPGEKAQHLVPRVGRTVAERGVVHATGASSPG